MSAKVSVRFVVGDETWWDDFEADLMGIGEAACGAWAPSEQPALWLNPKYVAAVLLKRHSDPAEPEKNS